MAKTFHQNKLLASILVVAISGFASEATAAASYQLTDLGDVYPTDINSAGQIGVIYPYSQWPNGPGYHGLLMPGNYSAIPIDLGFSPSAGYVFLNSFGQAAVSLPYLDPEHPRFWTPTVNNGSVGSIVFLSDVILHYESPSLVDIGDDGTLIGHGWDFYNNGGFRSWIWKPSTPNGNTTGTLFSLGGGGGATVELAAINNRGSIAGTDSNGAFVVIPTNINGVTGTTYKLSTSEIGKKSRADEINDAGQIVGKTAVGNRWHAMLWNPKVENGSTGTMLDLGVLPNQLQTFALDINNQGVVIGRADNNFTNSTSIEGSKNTTSFVWTANGGLQDIADLVDSSGDAWAFLQVFAINDHGQIVGSGLYDADGPGGAAAARRGFLLNPIPEPSCITMVIVALFCGQLGQRLRCRR